MAARGRHGDDLMLLGMFARRIIASAVSAELDPVSAELQTLSLFNRRATSNAGDIGGAKTIYGRKSGKLYFEAVADVRFTSPNNWGAVGILRTDSGYLIAGRYRNICGVVISGGPGSGAVFSNGSNVVTLAEPTDGMRYDFAADFSANLFWVRANGGSWNADALANPATGFGGISMGDLGSYDVTPGVTSDFPGQQVTFNFSAEDFVGSPPSGYSPWPTDTTGNNEGLGFTTLNSLRRENISLSGGDLVATRTGTPAMARSPDYFAGGRFYVEYTATDLNGSGDSCGVASFDATATNLVTDGTRCAVAYRSGSIWSISGNRGSIGAISNGDRVDVAIDLDLRLIWFRRNSGNWNGSSSADPASGVGGIAYDYDFISPAVSLGGGGSNGSSWSANLGASAMAGTLPVGFAAGWPRSREADVQYLWTGAVL